MDVLSAPALVLMLQSCDVLPEDISKRVPEGVSHSISEGDEALLVLRHQVASIEVGIAFHKHISQQLLLGQLLASSVAEERAEDADLGQQESRLP